LVLESKRFGCKIGLSLSEAMMIKIILIIGIKAQDKKLNQPTTKNLPIYVFTLLLFNRLPI